MERVNVQSLDVNITLFFFTDLPTVNGESCDAALEPSSSSTGDVLPSADDNEDFNQDAIMPDCDTAPNSTSQPLPTSTQAPASSSAAKPTDDAAAAAAASSSSSSLTSTAQGVTTITTSSSTSTSSQAQGETNASGGACGSSSSSTTATTDGAKPRQQVPSAGTSDPLPPG